MRIALILAYDRSRTGGAHRRLGRPEGRIQTVGARTGPGRRARAPASARAIGPAHRCAASLCNSTASTGAFPSVLVAAAAPRKSRRRPPRSAPRRLRFRAPQSPIRRCGQRYNGNRRHLHSSQRDQRRHAGRPGSGRARPAQSRWPHRRAASCGFSSAATPPSSGRFTFARSRIAAQESKRRRPLRRAHDAAHRHPSRREIPAGRRRCHAASRPRPRSSVSSKT